MRCRLCGNEQIKPLWVANQCQLDRCGRCDFVQVRQQPSEAELKQIYSASYFAHSKYRDEENQRRENRRRMNLIEQAGVADGARVLDAGCATGDFIEFVDGRFDMWGLDISPAAIELARQKNPNVAGQLHAGLLEQQSFEADFFDAVVLWDVIEHVWDPVATCQGLMRVLRPGGHLLLSTPDISAPIARVMKKRWAFMTPPEHLGFLGRNNMRQLLEGALGGDSVAVERFGKWVNLGFLFYKLRRVFPWIPEGLVRAIGNSAMSHWSLYIPTMDIQYARVRKPVEDR